MTLAELSAVRRKWLDAHFPYTMLHWKDFDFDILDNIIYRVKRGKVNHTCNDVFIMADTETSKSVNRQDNYVVAWTISIRAFDRNIVTLYGHKPSTLIECMAKLHDSMAGEQTIIYFHNLSYDWWFIRRFMFKQFGFPDKQLNTKPHYPILIEFKNGIILKDSLILAQRSLDKWANDLNAEHKKAIGFWDYDKIRTQSEVFSDEELHYIENDTLSGVECLDILCGMLNKHVHTMPFTATGIPREESRKIGKENNARGWFSRMAATYDQQMKLERVYHGGYTHGNRHFVNYTIRKNEVFKDYEKTECRDFSSSYPFAMFEKYPSEAFMQIDDCSVDYILDRMESYAFMFRFIVVRPRLKDDNVPMPALQYSKCTYNINAILDNGRVLCADYIEIYLTELDLSVIREQYIWDRCICTEVEVSRKEYLPKWLPGYVFKLYSDKCTLKNGDKVLYNLQKAKLNSVYGMCVQKPIKDNIQENYIEGVYYNDTQDPIEEYDKYINNRNTILPYQVGVWVTAYAFRNIFELGKCVDYENGGEWLYTDTDSCYATKWNEERLTRYNENCKKKMLDAGYGPVIYDGKEYWLGVAEFDGAYSEYRYQGAKRYCGRDYDTGKIKITVAGVPKSGASVLKSVDDFQPGLIFPGSVTGKLTHTYINVDDIFIENGIEYGDSIDLTPCDYLLDSTQVVDWESLFTEEVEVQVYGEDETTGRL